jgi:DNA replication protein DnaC
MSRDEVGKIRKRLETVEVLILDELGFVPFDRTGAELLFNLLVDRYQRRATVIKWGQVFCDERMTATLLDRPAENAHVVTTTGASHRTRGRLSTT